MDEADLVVQNQRKVQGDQMTGGKSNIGVRDSFGDWAKSQAVELCKTVVLIFLDVLAVLALFGGLAVISEALKFFAGKYGFSDTFTQFFHGMHEVINFCSYTVLGVRSVNHFSRGFVSRVFNRLFSL